MATRVVSGSIGWLVGLAASSLIAFGLFAITRTTSMVLLGRIRPFSETAVWVIGLTCLAIVGVLLLARVKTRSLGALLLAASSFLVHFALYDLTTKSSTIGAMSFDSPGWTFAIACLIGSLVTLFLAATVLWSTQRKAAS